ncbi:two-component regulator propeller domain-containing protein [Fibrella sp. WM1]|uniref:sensor histidine kinase n=1 Tax=Fibrella musci TaxID=3242485 RepID=UPI003522199B
MSGLAARLLAVGMSWLLLGMAVTAAAQSRFFETWGQAQGLSQGTGYAVAEYDDFRWVGTQDGLNRFDGYGFRVFRAGGAGSLSNNMVQALFTDSQGRFWVGTAKGLNLYQPISEQFIAATTYLKQPHTAALGQASVEQIIEDSSHTVWVLTDAHGLLALRRNRPVTVFFGANLTLQNACLGPGGVLWLATRDVIYRHNPQTDQFEPVLSRSNVSGTYPLPSASPFRLVAFDQPGRLWVGTRSDGLFWVEQPGAHARVQPWRAGATGLSSNELSALLMARDGHVWIGTRTGGLTVYDPQARRFSHYQREVGEPHSLTENNVWSLFEDHSGLIWVGFSSQGVAKHDPRQFVFQRLQQHPDRPADPRSLPDNMIFRIVGQGQQVYIGTATGGLARVDRTTGRVTALLPTQAGSEVRVIVPDAQGRLWLANWQGLYAYDIARQTVQTYPVAQKQQGQPYVFAAHMVADPATRQTREVWVGGQTGLLRFDVRQRQWLTWHDHPVLLRVTGLPIRLLHPDPIVPDRLWIGTLNHGLFAYDRQTRRLWSFERVVGLGTANIRSVWAGGRTIWVGTDAGLFRIDRATMRLLRHYTHADGLPNEVIYGILPDDAGTLWLSSNQGLTQFSPTRGVLITYDETDGLQGNEFNTNACFKDPDGTLFFGGVNGVSYFRPPTLLPPRTPPTVRLTALTVLDSVYTPNRAELRLAADQNFITIGFTALNFANPRRTQYRYQLIGLDPAWVQAGTRRTANYTKLPPGDYRFRVQARTDGGPWNPQGASVWVRVAPPYWQTIWFRVGLIALLVTGIWGVYRFRLRQVQRQLTQEMVIAIRTQELERQRFAKELHDGIGANLSVLKLYLSSLGKGHTNPEVIRGRAMAVLNSSVSDIRALINDMHPRSLSQQGLAQTLTDMVAMLNDTNQLYLQLDVDNVPSQLPQAIEINLFRVVQELVQNTLKHANAQHVWLSLHYKANTLTLSYRDDGRGMAGTTPASTSGHGIINIRQRIDLLKGTCQLDNEPGKGMCTVIEVPVAGL